MKFALKRKLAFIASSILLVLALISVRALWEGYDALERGDLAIEAGKPEEAIRWWRRAARWYVPMSPHVDSAYGRMQMLAEQAESNGQPKLSLQAWRGVRSSIRATTSFYVPQSDRVELADKKISELMAREESFDDDVDVKARQAEHFEMLQRDDRPAIGWTIFALLGLTLWVGSGFGFAIRGLDESDRLVPKAAAYSGAGILVGLVLWLLGLSLA